MLVCICLLLDVRILGIYISNFRRVYVPKKNWDANQNATVDGEEKSGSVFEIPNLYQEPTNHSPINLPIFKLFFQQNPGRSKSLSPFFA